VTKNLKGRKIIKIEYQGEGQLRKFEKRKKIKTK